MDFDSGSDLARALAAKIDDARIDALLVALSRGGFSLPYAARSADHATLESLQAADAKAHADNRAALRLALLDALRETA